MAWCIEDDFRNIGLPLWTFDVPIDLNGVMEPQMADGEVINPSPVDGSVEMDVEPEPRALYEDPAPMDEEVNAPEAMEQDLDEDRDVEESSLEDDRGWFVGSGMEPDSEDEAAAALVAQEAEEAQDMDSKEFESNQSSSEASFAEPSNTSDLDWAL